jgi:chemotaxis-related protein WspB
MLFLLFRLGGDRYALDAGRVEEVLPLVQLKHIPRAPVGVVGIFNLRGTAVPVLDLSLLALGRTARIVMSTRIILVRYPEDEADGHLLGLIAENATEMMRRESSDFVDAGLRNGDAPYLGPVTQDGHGLVQLIVVDQLLTQSVRDVLFQDASAS